MPPKGQRQITESYTRWPKRRIDLLIRLRTEGAPVREQERVLEVRRTAIWSAIVRLGLDEYKCPRMRSSAWRAITTREKVLNGIIRGLKTGEIMRDVPVSRSQLHRITAEFERVGMVYKSGHGHYTYLKDGEEPKGDTDEST